MSWCGDFRRLNMRNTVATLCVLGVLVVLPAIALGAGFLFIDDNGNVGIGNVDPQSRLDVSGMLYSRLISLDSASTTVDWDEGNVQTITLDSNPTLTFDNGEAGGLYSLIVKQDGEGGRTVTWPGDVRWIAGVAPVLAVAVDGVDVINFVYDGTNYLGSPSVDRSSPLAQGLIAYWKFDESSGNAADARSNTYTLTNNNSVAYSSGKIGNAADFGSSNTNKYLSVASALGMKSNEPFTYNFWLKMTTQPGTNTADTPIQWSDNSTPDKKLFAEVQVYNNGGTMETYIDRRQESGGDQIGTPNEFTTGTWYMLTYTWDGQVQKLYVNAATSPLLEQASTIDGENASTGQSTHVNFGADTVEGRYLSGLIDEAGIWNRALSSDEIAALYNGGNATQYPF